MNEKINLCEILKNCPKDTEFWSDNYGKVKLINVGQEWDTPIEVELSDGSAYFYTEEGWCNKHLPANCMLWPSKDCRDWGKWQCPKPRFDPKALKAFDRVLIKDIKWECRFFNRLEDNYDVKRSPISIMTSGGGYSKCVPYNDDTKHLVGTTDEAPEYYRYWED